MPRRIKLVIFDLDGTLVDAYQAVALSLNHALQSFGFSAVDDRTVQRSVGWGEKILISKFVPSEQLDQVLSVYRRHHSRALKSHTKFLPDARTMLNFLKKDGYALAIASNRPSRFTHIILKHLVIADFFSAVVCADEVIQPKPAPDMLKRILNRTSVQPDDALYVGDMTIDVQTGEGAGVRTVCVLTGSCTREELQVCKPFGIIPRLGQLRNILDELNIKN